MMIKFYRRYFIYECNFAFLLFYTMFKLQTIKKNHSDLKGSFYF